MMYKSFSKEEFYSQHNYEASTPMMRQFLDIKFLHQDCFLLFRMGDFYELFHDDAEKVSKILGIALAKRGKIDEKYIPMCGVPHHALENYLPKLLESGIKVALCDQMESPEEAKKRDGYKAVVRRDVVRIITPGTIIDDTILNPFRPSYLASIATDKDEISICYTDITTGAIKVVTVLSSELSSELSKISPKEILISENSYKKEEVKRNILEFDLKLVFQSDQIFEVKRCITHIENYYELASYNSFGNLNKSQISAIGSILQYLAITQKANMPRLETPIFESTKDYMILDQATRKSLEITESPTGKKSATLLSSISKTVTSGGGRLLYTYLNTPLTSYSAIKERQSLTDFFVENNHLSKKIQNILEHVPDLERALSKVIMRRSQPFHLLTIKSALQAAYLIKEILYKEFGLQTIPDQVKALHDNFTFDYSVLDLIAEAVRDDSPNNMSEGGFINLEYHPKLSELSNIIKNGANLVERLRVAYQLKTNIDNLKINQNNVLGLFIEVSAKNAQKMLDPIYIHRQTTANSVRYTTKELQELESKMVNANSLSVALEHEIYEKLCIQIEKKANEIRKIAKSLSNIDVFCSFAQIAKDNNYIKPEIVEDNSLIITSGRHPVIERQLKLKQEQFIVNDSKFNENERIILLTGPNMGGKSTYLRQNALIAIMAQIGSYVPASYCKIGIIDRIFSRVGSGDDLSGGKSTFMVEMIETSAILSQATESSLVILDEVGRGTSTFDGMAIAWAILEHIYSNINCRTLFATHYHELTSLSSTLKTLKNYSVEIKELDGVIHLTHKVIPAPADKSYGIHVAGLAGLPKSLIRRANSILLQLEKNHESKNHGKAMLYENDLFSSRETKDLFKDKYINLSKKISEYSVDDLSPKEAHSILCELQDYAKSN